MHDACSCFLEKVRAFNILWNFLGSVHYVYSQSTRFSRFGQRRQQNGKEQGMHDACSCFLEKARAHACVMSCDKMHVMYVKSELPGYLHNINEQTHVHINKIRHTFSVRLTDSTPNNKSRASKHA